MIKYNLKIGRTPNPYRKRGGRFLPVLATLVMLAAGLALFFTQWKPGRTGKTKQTVTVDDALKYAPAALKVKYLEASEALNAQRVKEARRLGLEIIEKLPDKDPFWYKTAELLSRSNTMLLFSNIASGEKSLYVVKPGDSLDKIAKKYNTTIELIVKSNKLDPTDDKIVPGQKLYLYRGEWNILISKKNFKLYLYDAGQIFRVYDIGIGVQDKTPEGTFYINVKQSDPDWYYQGKKYPYGSKENILGTRWMSLEPKGDTDKTLSGYGIHGTWDASCIGKTYGNGCIRMCNDDVNELYSILPRGTEVIIL
ncbi:MAG: hypothetical protein A2020_03815 [Lentisphaerae bacterium GWF2_45_14]|nr:MAG: hypothetical protein A2020_03815 [Lentisphaerae bacterium GWF2_45_14]